MNKSSDEVDLISDLDYFRCYVCGSVDAWRLCVIIVITQQLFHALDILVQETHKIPKLPLQGSLIVILKETNRWSLKKSYNPQKME